MDVQELMTTPLVTLRTWHTMQQAARTLLESEISGAPVLDHEDRPVGVLTKTDLLRYETQYAGPAAGELRRAARESGGWLPEREREEDYVLRWMTRGAVSVLPRTRIEAAAELMARRHLHRLFVHEGDALIGVVTPFDILRVVGAITGRGRRGGGAMSRARRRPARPAARRAKV